MPKPKCPSQEQLQAFITADLPEESADEVFAHLGTCVDCRSTLDAQYQQIKNTRNPALKSLDEQPIVKDPVFQRAVEQIEQYSSEDPIEVDHLKDEEKEHNLIGKQIDQYRIVAKLSESNIGTVYKAVHIKLDKVVELKVLPAGSPVSDERIARLEREMLSVGRLNHPHIVGATDAREIDGTHFLVMEHLEGIDLAVLIERMGPLPISDACEIIRQAAVGLQYAHQHDLIHRNIKPSNLMLTTDGEIKILNLGLALIQDDEAIESQNDGPAKGELTSTGQNMRALDYVAPEQIDHSHDVDIRTDLYSLGCTFFKLLTGEVPFEHLNSVSTSQRMEVHSEKPAPSVSKPRIEIPDALSAIVDRLLAKNPDERFGDPEQLVQALELFTAGNDLKALSRKFRQPDSNSDSAHSSPLDSISSAEVDTDYAQQYPHQTQAIDQLTQVASLRGKVHRFLLVFKLSAVAVVLLLLTAVVILLPIDKGKLTSLDPNLKIVHNKTPDAVPSTNFKGGEIDRVVAEWVLSVDGRLYVRRLLDEKYLIEVFSKEMLPTEQFEIFVVGFDNKSLFKGVNDDNIINLKGLSGLEELFLGETEVTGHGISLLAPMPSLKRIHMPRKFDEVGLKSLSQLKGLRHVGLETSSYTDACIIHLNEIPQLVRLELTATAITDKGFYQLSAQQLSSIRLAENFELTDVALEHLQNFPKLEHITILGNSNNRILSDSGLAHLQKLKQLRSVYLIHTKVTAAGIAAFKRALPDCKVDWNGLPLEIIRNKIDLDCLAAQEIASQ